MSYSVGLNQDLAVEIELDEARGVHLLVEHAVGIDEKRRRPRPARGSRLWLAIISVHVVEVDQAVGGGEIDALSPTRPR